jgi:two-component sensor histidine kinase
VDRLENTGRAPGPSLESLKAPLQRKVGLAASALGVGVLATIAANQIAGKGLTLGQLLVTPQFLALLVTTGVLIWTAVRLSRAARATQVILLIVTAYLSALDTTPGDVTSAVFLTIGYGLAWQYGFLVARPMLKIAVVGAFYIACLALGLLLHAGGAPWAALHTSVGVIVFGYMGFALVRTRFKAGNIRQAQLEDTVRERTADLQHRLSEIEGLKGELEDSLRDKENLLRELHHRTKNNLQLVLSFIDIEKHAAPADEVLEVTEGRIRSLAAVHEHLLLDRDSSDVDIDALIRTTALALWSAAGASSRRFHIDATSDTRIHVDLAIPLGLVANELIANALKYGQGREVPIGVELRAEGEMVCLTISTPAESPDNPVLLEGVGEGNRIVHGLVRQLHGSIETERLEKHVQVVVRAPISEQPSNPS